MLREHSKLRQRHTIIVVELDSQDGREVSEKSYLYVTSSSQQPETFFENLLVRQTNLNLPGRPIRLLQDLVHNYKPSRRKDVVARRLKETKERLDEIGYIVFPHWRVYVLDVDPNSPEPLLDRGERNHVVYVGQTSKDIKTRLLEHQGRRRDKDNRYLGAPKTKGRNPQINQALTPKKRIFSKQDALEFETSYSQELKDAGYRVLGDGLTDPIKKRMHR